MISAYITGGLGNKMFITAWAESWRKRGYDVCYPRVDYEFNYIVAHYAWTRHAHEYRTIFKNFHWDNHKTGARLPLVRIREMYMAGQPKDGHEYHGYFQSEKNFYDRWFIEWLFEPAPHVKAQVDAYRGILGGETCSIHVRRGNYLVSKGVHPVLGMDYYNEAMGTMRNIDKFVVFSDDIPWCKENFIGDKFIFIKDKDYVEMFLMSRCTHHIIANSSFSWWGAWLEERDNTKVIAPKTWFGDNALAEHIIPERWVKI